MANKVYFNSLEDLTFFRFPGSKTIYRKIAVCYKGTTEVNYEDFLGKAKYLNWMTHVIEVKPTDPVPTDAQLDKE